MDLREAAWKRWYESIKDGLFRETDTVEEGIPGKRTIMNKTLI